MEKRTWSVECLRESGEPYTVEVLSSTLNRAKARAANEGHQIVGTIDAETDGGDAGLIMVCLLIPILGLVVAGIRGGTKRSGAAMFACVSVASAILWACLLGVAAG